MVKRNAAPKATFFFLMAVWAALFLPGCDRVESVFSTPTLRVFQSVTPQPTYTLHPSQTAQTEPNSTAAHTDTADVATGTQQFGAVKAAVITNENAADLQLVSSTGLGSPLQAAFSGDGEGLIVSTTHGLYFFDPASLEQKAALQTSQQQVSLALSANGDLAASGDWRGQVTVWDVSGSVLRELDAGKLPVLAAAFSPDGNRLAASSWDGVIRIWRMDNGQFERTLEVRNRPAEALAYSGDGEVLFAWAQGESVQVWDAETGAPREDIYLGKDPLGYAPRQVVFGKQGEYLAVYYTRNIKVFITHNGYTQMALSDVTEPVQSLALSEDGSTLAVMLLAQTGGLQVRIYATETGVLINRINLAETGAIPVMALAPDGNTLVTVNGLLQTWAVVPGEDQTEPIFSSSRREFFPGTVLDAQPGLQDQVYLVSGTGSVQEADIANGGYTPVMVRPFSAEAGAYTASALLPDERIAFGDAQGNVSLLEWGSDTVTALQPHTGAVRSLAFSPDGSLLASSADDGLVILHDLTGSGSNTTSEIGEPALRMAFQNLDGEPDPDLFVQTDSHIQLWSLAEGMQQQWTAQSMTLSAENDLLATAHSGAEGTVNVYRVPEGELLQNFPLEGYRLALSPDGSVLAMAGRDLSLWSTGDGELLQRISGYPCCGEIFFSTDGASLIQVQADGSVQVWQIR